MHGDGASDTGQSHDRQASPQRAASTSSASNDSVRQLYTVTPMGAVAYCAGVFGLAVITMSVLSYRRGLIRLKAEGFAEEDAQKAFPYAAKAFSIATSMVSGAGVAGGAVLYASGLDLKNEAQVASVQEAYGLVKGREFGGEVGKRIREWGAKNLWSISKPPAAEAQSAAQPGART